MGICGDLNQTLVKSSLHDGMLCHDKIYFIYKCHKNYIIIISLGAFSTHTNLCFILSLF